MQKVCFGCYAFVSKTAKRAEKSSNLSQKTVFVHRISAVLKKSCEAHTCPSDEPTGCPLDKSTLPRALQWLAQLPELPLAGSHAEGARGSPANNTGTCRCRSQPQRALLSISAMVQPAGGCLSPQSCAETLGAPSASPRAGLTSPTADNHEITSPPSSKALFQSRLGEGVALTESTKCAF